MAGLGQCQAQVYTITPHSGSLHRQNEQCPLDATVTDPRGPKLCWVHHKAFNNPNRRPLHLRKSADGVPR